MPSAEKETLKPWCVFVIDDSPEDREEIRRMLLNGSDRRLTFIEAETGAAGIIAVLNAVPLPDCVILDYYLPDMEAPEFLAALTESQGVPVCPVVVMTGGASREHGRSVLRAGAQDYIGKDWTSAPALVRAMENACESWAMARELRERKHTLRRVADRESFRNLFSDATRDLRDEHALMRVSSRLLGHHLQASRVFYEEVGKEGIIAIEKSYVSGVRQFASIYSFSNYNPKLIATLMAGKSLVVSDVHEEDAYSETELANYAQLELSAYLATPVLRNGQLVAVLAVHQNAPRDWTPEDISIAREIAERTWAAIEHARADGNLLAKDLQLSQMMEITPSFSAVLAGPRFIFQMANQSYFDLIGRGPEIIGKPLIEALPEIVDQPFADLLEEVYRLGKPFEVKSMAVRLPRGPNASLIDIFVDFSYLPLRESDGRISRIFIHGLDRTEEVRANKAIAQGERELRSVTENTPDMLARFDRQLRYLFVNSVTQKIMRRPEAEILGKTHSQLGIPTNLRDQWDKAIRHVFDHQSDTRLEFSLDTPHHGPRHFSCRLVPEFDEIGQLVSALSVTHDVTERRAYEQRLLEQDIRKDEFLATLAHELRNPLAPIRTGLQLLKLSPTAEVAAQTLSVMERQLGQMVRLIDDLLDVSRISSGKIMLKRKRTTFQEIAVTVLEMSRPLIDTAGHSLSIEWPEDSVWLDADPTRLAQVFSNLLINSSRYMQRGGHIKFSARQQADSVLISVMDTGMGIPVDMLDTVFDMFTQIGRTLDHSQGGLGVGLALVKTLVELHGGSVRAASDGLDLGSEFTVILPTISVPETDAPEPLIRPVSVPTAGYRIMVVDDNVDAAESMAMLLDLWGHDVRAAFGGQEALELATTFRPHVMFLDIGMPGMDGHEVARRLLADPATAKTKLIALTGWGTEYDIRRSKTAGFHAHFTKPVDPDVVEAMLATMPIDQNQVTRNETTNPF